MSDGNGLSQRDLLLEVRNDVKEIKVKMAEKVDKADFRRLDERVNKMDLTGSHGLINLQQVTKENRDLIEGLVSWRNRLYGMYALMLFMVPVIGYISWHVFS